MYHLRPFIFLSLLFLCSYPHNGKTLCFENQWCCKTWIVIFFHDTTHHSRPLSSIYIITSIFCNTKSSIFLIEIASSSSEIVSFQRHLSLLYQRTEHHLSHHRHHHQLLFHEKHHSLKDLFQQEFLPCLKCFEHKDSKIYDTINPFGRLLIKNFHIFVMSCQKSLVRL